MPTATCEEVRTVLFVAAERFELKHIRQRPGEHWILAANGPGPRLAGRAADLVDQRVDAVVSVGLCGGLAEELRVGDIVVGTAVNGAKIAVPVSVLPHIQGPIASIDRVAQTVGEKRDLRATGAIAVEMEAAAVMERARLWGAPFYCVRAVSDTSAEGFVLDFNASRDASGRFRPGRIVAQALRQPAAGIPELLRLRRCAAVAARALGDFIGNCSF